MKFYDKVNITCVSGKWWDGATAARREAGVPYGGPSGGNGGHGGSVIFQADSNYNTLLHLRFQKERTAQEGFPGESADKYGKSAEDLIIPVPVGSIICIVDAIESNDNQNDESEEYEDEDLSGEDNLELKAKKQEPRTIVYHFTEHGEQYKVCKWGIGGAGNMHFKNSLVQYPDFSLFGEPGQKKMIEVELQLLADVWLIGMPSVGKSSIINSISNSKAKVAEYHFTTLVPNLGSVKRNDTGRNIIDIPGLVEGASEGKGLWNEFLRHVLKARLFAFVLDISRWDEGIKEFGILWNEIIAYIKTRFVWSMEFGYEITDIRFALTTKNNQLILYIYDQDDNLLLQKGIVWIVNKIDEVMDDEIINEYKNQLIEHIIKTFEERKIKDLKTKDILNVLNKQIMEYSTILDNLKKPLLQFMYEKLQGIEEYIVRFDPVEAKKLESNRSIELIGTIDEEDVQDLLSDLWYQIQEREQPDGFEDEDFEDEEELEESDDEEVVVIKEKQNNQKEAVHVKQLFRISERELNRLAYQMHWWKVLAEEWFWRVMKQQGMHKRLNKSWVKTWDLLRVVADYDSNKHIIFPYMLGTGKTSYRVQKLT
jgi:GTP-binding protein